MMSLVLKSRSFLELLSSLVLSVVAPTSFGLIPAKITRPFLSTFTLVRASKKIEVTELIQFSTHISQFFRIATFLKSAPYLPLNTTRQQPPRRYSNFPLTLHNNAALNCTQRSRRRALCRRRWNKTTLCYSLPSVRDSRFPKCVS